MSFCKKSVHSFLGLTNYPMNVINIDVNTIEKPSCKCQGVCTTIPSGLGLINATSDVHKTPNVLESAAVKSSSPYSTPPSSPPSSSSSSFSMFKKDPGGIGFIDDIGGGVDGLMSCTESLGFESCDERRVDDEIDELCSRASSTVTKVKWRKVGERREVKKFPPPLSSLNHNGQPSFFLRPVRKDGRLELTEVRIDRPEIFHASRQDGRLRLHLVRNEEFDSNEEEEEKEQEQEHEFKQEHKEELVDGKEGEQEEEVKKGDEKEERLGEWGFPVNGEGFRCHDLVTHPHDCHHHHHSNHHHNLHVWSQHCVTTR